MSDIDFKIEWWELILLSPIWGWPGLIIGAIVGSLAWKKRPIVGGVVGAIVGNFVAFAVALYFA